MKVILASVILGAASVANFILATSLPTKHQTGLTSLALNPQPEPPGRRGGMIGGGTGPTKAIPIDAPVA